MFEKASLDDLKSFYFGHAQDETAGTGCSVFIAPKGGACGIDVRGGGPATRETDLLKPENMIQDVHAIVLSGGSAFGLEASCGVMEALAERKIGFELGGAYVPIVVGACLFDLLVGKAVWPGKEMGHAATNAAFAQGKDASRDTFAQGNVGAGCGATVGKFDGGAHAMKSGFGWYCLRKGELVVAAFVAVNALGSICDKDGTWIAGMRTDDGLIAPPLSFFASKQDEKNDPCVRGEYSSNPCTNTTIGAVLTNARLTKAQATKISSTVHDAYARAIKPVHSSNDGDTVFTFASREVEAPFDLVAVIATEAMQNAIISAVKNAKSAFGLPCAKDIAKGVC